MTKAWHLRQDGKAFPVKVHLYCMGDEDLSSEAEVAAFIVSTNSKDKDLAYTILDAWMALLIENEVSYDADEDSIEKSISSALKSLPYKFQYPLTESQLLSIHRRLNNYYDVDTLYEYVDRIKDTIEDIQEEIKLSLNQQFCRVRYGGQYNSVAGNSEVWFRISSTGYNWVNTIYIFTSSLNKQYRLSHITICRDSESDGDFGDTSKEYFYKAKDGALYKHMPIEEYLIEEHEHNPVFESVDMNRGVIDSYRKLLSQSFTPHEILRDLKESTSDIYNKNLWKYLLRYERSKCVPSGPRGRR